MSAWRIERAIDPVDEQPTRLDSLLADGWEPFAVTTEEYGRYLYHLRLRDPERDSGGG